MSISRNMTEEHLKAVMAVLPDKMDGGELCALTLTVYSTYQDDPAEVISSLIAAVYTYGKAKGFSMDTISDGLRMSADLHDENLKTKH
jgi:hypothetical protein